MAIPTHAPAAGLLSYEEYMAEGLVEDRYNIVDGVRIFMPAPTWEHQEILANVFRALDRYNERTKHGKVLIAPLDVLIWRVPRLQVRQPDAFYISHARLAEAGGAPRKGPLEIAPELVVEITSNTETQHDIDSKTADYISIGVQEEWIVRSERRSVEVLQLTANGPVSIAIYEETEALQSFLFPDLIFAVADLFRT